MRECRRILEPGGRLAALVIEATPGLSIDERKRAVELGPSSVLAPDGLASMVDQVALRVLESVDLTEEFRAVVSLSLRELEADEPALRAGEGDVGYEEELEKKRKMLAGIDLGLLVRTLVVAERDGS